jgi:hypothetical protein
MRPLVGALLSGALAFQLMLTGTGMLCVMPHDAAMASMETHTAMGPKGDRSAAASNSQSETNRMPTPGRQPCDHPSMPAHCLALAACASSAIASARIAGPAMPDAASPAIVAFVAAPPTPSAPPELPPPRA